MRTTTETKTATYKGRKYRLLWTGKTKYGMRAKLGFWDGSEEFWVDAGLVSISTSGPRSSHEGEVRCRHCGKWTAEGDDWCMECGRADYER